MVPPVLVGCAAHDGRRGKIERCEVLPEGVCVVHLIVPHGDDVRAKLAEHSATRARRIAKEGAVHNAQRTHHLAALRSGERRRSTLLRPRNVVLRDYDDEFVSERARLPEERDVPRMEAVEHAEGDNAGHTDSTPSGSPSR